MSSRDERATDRDSMPAGASLLGTTLGLGATSKIRDRHLDRLAIVYVRGSTED